MTPAAEAQVGCVDPDAHGLNEHQRAALLSDAPATFVTAAAGSGKTRVLTLRVARALLDERASIDSIVAITFTERAAQEMKERIAGLLADAGAHELVDRVDDAWISTIHGLCSRLLREFSYQAGIDPAAEQLSDASAGEHLSRSIAAALRSTASDPPDGIDPADVVDMRARYGDDRIEELVKCAWRLSQRQLSRTVEVMPCGPRESDAAILQHLLKRTAASYAWRKRQDNCLDFDDLEHLTLELLSHPLVTRAVQSRFHLLLVDEFQDTNAVQCRLIDLIAPQRALYVGDEWQSIYRFRGADVDVFRERAGGTSEQVRLDTNYRSSERVLDFVNHLFTEALGPAYQPVSHAPGREGGVPPRLVLMDGADARAAEARWVAARIRELMDAGERARDCLVLVPQRTRMSATAAALRAAGLEVVEASGGFFDDPAVQDIITLLTAVADPTNVTSLLGVCRSPAAGATLDELLTAEALSDGTSHGLIDALRDSPAASIQRAIGLVDELRELAHAALPTAVVRAACQLTEAEAIRIARWGDRQSVANLRKLQLLTADAVAAGITDIGALLDHWKLMDQRASEPAATMSDEGRDAVRVMTVHAAKGLEARYVFVVDTANGGRNARDPVLATGSGQVAFVARDADGCPVEDPAAWKPAVDIDKAQEQQESRRLMYVAMTRAEEELVVLGSVTRRKNGTPGTGPGKQGPLSWILAALELDGQELPQPGSQSPIAGGRAVLEVVSPEAVPAPVPPVTPSETTTATIPADLLIGIDAPPEPDPAIVPWPPDEPVDAAVRERGIRLHAAIEAVIRNPQKQVDAVAAHQLADAEQELLERFIAQPWLAQLVDAGAEPELSFTALDESGQPVTGRIDLLLRSGDSWTIVDFKSSLPASDDAAWRRHAEQLGRYVQAAHAAGAVDVTVHLAAVDDPGRVVTRKVARRP